MESGYSLAILLVLFISFVSGNERRTTCYGPGHLACTSPQLTCGDGYVISVATGIYGRKSNLAACPSGGDICTAPDECCQFKDARENVEQLPPEIMKSVQQNCTYQQSCSLNLPYVSSPLYHFTSFEYSCIEASSVLSLMCKDTISASYASYMFYFGKQRKDKLAVNCSCELQSDSTVTMYTRYVHLSPETCPSFASTLSRFQLPTCNETGFTQEYKFVAHLPPPVVMSVENLIAKPEDIFWMYFYSRENDPISVTCSGCGIDIAGACGRTSHVLETCYGGEPCSEHKLQCKEGQYIALTSSTYFGGRYYISPVCQESTCNTRKSCCSYASRDTLRRFNEDELDTLYQSCLFKQTCISTPQYKDPGNSTYAFYRYECIPESSTINMMEAESLTGFTEIFLKYNGSERTDGTVIDCGCNVTSSAPSVTLTIYQIRMHPDSCCQFEISSPDTNLPEGCSAQGLKQFYSRNTVVDVPLQINFNKMVARQGNVVVLRISGGKGVDVTCGGCQEQKVASEDVCDYPTPTLPQSTTEDLPPHPKKVKGDHTMVIASAVLGSLVFILIICFIIWRCKKSNNEKVAAALFNM